MARLTSDWTDRHVAVAGPLVVSAVAGALATLNEAPYSFLLLGVVVLTVLAALSLDAFGGIVTGFVAAAVVIAARQLGGHWSAEDFGIAVATTGVLVLLGWLTGTASGTLQRRDVVRGSPVWAAPAPGSLGLLSTELAVARLDEEVARARRHRRPLVVVLLSVEFTDDSLDEAARGAARRTVARLVESLVPDTAVPFALAPGEVGAILPETDEAAAWQLLGPVVDAASRASFVVREQDERRSLADCTELHAGLVALSDTAADADALLAAARRALRENRQDGAEDLFLERTAHGG